MRTDAEWAKVLINADLVQVDYNAKPGRALVRERHYPGVGIPYISFLKIL